MCESYRHEITAAPGVDAQYFSTPLAVAGTAVEIAAADATRRWARFTFATTTGISTTAVIVVGFMFGASFRSVGAVSAGAPVCEIDGDQLGPDIGRSLWARPSAASQVIQTVTSHQIRK